MLKRILTPFIVLLMSVLSACGGSDGEKEVSVESSSPEYTATKFFYAVYGTKGVEETQKYVVPKLQRIIKSYGSNKAVARNLLNMQFDNVEVKVDKGRNLRESYGDKATIALVLTGTFQGDKKIDTRTVKLIKRNGNWFISKIMDDPWAR
jgi:hypothetical protein